LSAEAAPAVPAAPVEAVAPLESLAPAAAVVLVTALHEPLQRFFAPAAAAPAPVGVIH
jgi:hypothetical protein